MTIVTPPEPHLPFVLTEKVRGALRIAATNAAALSSGLTPGLGLADARARFPDLLAVEMDQNADNQLLSHLANIALSFTPIVAIDPPSGLILDITGCIHLFGGEDGLVREASRRIGLGNQLSVRSALASHPDSARAIVRWGSPALAKHESIAALPIAALELEEESARALRRAGLTTVNMVRSRSMASIAARFGETTVRALRRLYGEESRPLAIYEVPPLFVAERRFAEPIGKTTQILDIAHDMMKDLARTLRREDQGGRAFRLSLFRSDGDIRNLLIETGQATRDPEMIKRLFHERIDHLVDPLDPGFGYDMLRLSILQCETLLPQQIEKGIDGHGNPQKEEAVTALLDRLAVRYGAEAIRSLLPHDSHIPERAQRAHPANSNNTASIHWELNHNLDEPPSRPFWLFDPPENIDVFAEVPDGPPRLFRWRDRRYDVALAEGPERIAGEWWRAARGHWHGHGSKEQSERTRDYYRVEDQHGLRFWLFRAGLYGDVSDNRAPSWFIHGLFA